VKPFFILNISAVFLVVAIMGCPSLSFGYEEAEVSRGGTLHGITTLNGVVPSPVVFQVSRAPFSKYCEKISDGKGHIALEEYHVGPDGGMQDVIVAVQEVKRGKPFAPVLSRFFATDCMFHPAEVSHHEMMRSDEHGRTHHVHPLVTVFQDNQPISVINQDPIPHNGQIFQQENGHILLNFPIPVSEKKWGGVPHFTKGKKIVQMICGMHEYMQTYGLVVDNPYYAKTKRDGRFVIDQLLPGKYQVWAWHPHFKPIIKEVTVTEGESVSLNFEFQSKWVRPRIFESIEGFRAFAPRAGGM
jgi:hypothetical protein